MGQAFSLVGKPPVGMPLYQEAIRVPGFSARIQLQLQLPANEHVVGSK